MILIRRSLVAALALISWLVAGASAAYAQAPPAAQATIGGQQVSFAAPLGLWDPARHHVSIVFFTTPPSSAAEATARQTSQWAVRPGEPAVVVDMDFSPTSTSGMLGDVTSCRVSFSGFRTPLDLKGGATDCHLLSTGGLLRPGGMFIGLVQGQGKDYSVRLPFSVAFLAAQSGAPAASAAPAPATTPASRTASAPVTAAPAIPANSVSGSVTFSGQTLTVSRGVAWFTASDSQVEVALFDHVPTASMLAELRAGSWGEGGPIVTMSLRIKPGAPLVPASVTYCYVNVDFPKGGPMGTGTNAAGCGLTVIGGDTRAGGQVVARLKNHANGPNGAPFTWDLQFTLPIAK